MRKESTKKRGKKKKEAVSSSRMESLKASTVMFVPLTKKGKFDCKDKTKRRKDKEEERPR